jgi:sigma-B regulation protein RsbU (phosphoserine phosphatase)
MFRPKSLQQRLAIFMLFPVAVLLIGMGFVGFIYARNNLHAQWREAAVLKLQRAAHSVDMRLSRITEWIQVLDVTGESQNPDIIYSRIVDKIENVEGVSRVTLTWFDKKTEPTGASNTTGETGRMGGRMGKSAGMPGNVGERSRMIMRRFHRARLRGITPPRYDSLIKHKTVSLISDLIDKNGQTIGRFEVILRFDHLIADIIER